MVRGRRVETRPLLFGNYVFIWIEVGWWRARWAPGVSRVVLDGEEPGHVSDSIISALKKREVNGAIEVPRGGFQLGEAVRIVTGPFVGKVGIFHGQSRDERVVVLMQLIGLSRVELRRDAIRPVT